MSYTEVENVVEQQQDDVFSTPELVAPKPEPIAHRATITAVTGRHVGEKETPAIDILWVSRDIPTVEGKMTIWIPRAYEAAGFAADFDPTTMEPGQQTSFRIGIASSDKRAALQQLVFNADSVARAAGRNPKDLGLKRATTLEEYAANLNSMLQGVEAIAFLRARGGDDPAFANNLEAKRFAGPDAYEQRPKMFKGYRLAWQND